MTITRRFVPAYIDHHQSDMYRHEATIVAADGSLWAVFGDGQMRPSVYPNVDAMIEAGRRDYVERMREVSV